MLSTLRQAATTLDPLRPPAAGGEPRGSHFDLLSQLAAARQALLGLVENLQLQRFHRQFLG
jgi:hypothetical protein